MIDKQMFKGIVEYPIYGKRILEALLTQILGEPVEILEYISSIKNNKHIIVETKNSYINIEVNSNDYTAAKRLRNYMFFSSFCSYIDKFEKNYIQINLNYGHIYDTKTDAGIINYYLQTNELEKFVSNITIMEINVDNLKRECSNGIKNEYDYRYVFMFDLDTEELEKYYPDDDVVNDFFAMSTLNYEDFWIDPDEDKAKLLNTERNINFSKGLKKGSNEEKMNVIRNLLSVNSTIETIAVAVGL